MGLGGTKKKASKKGENKKSKWVNMAQVCQGTGDNGDYMYVKVNAFKGRLLWQAYGGENGDDTKDSTWYEVKSLAIFDPHENAPDFVLQSLSCNLENPKHAVLAASNDGDEE